MLSIQHPRQRVPTLSKTRQPRSGSAICVTGALNIFGQFFFLAFSRRISVWIYYTTFLYPYWWTLLKTACRDFAQIKSYEPLKIAFSGSCNFAAAAPAPSQDTFSLIFFLQSFNSCRPMKLGVLIPYGFGIVTFSFSFKISNFFFLKFHVAKKPVHSM